MKKPIIEFDDDTHTYTIDGRAISNVTSVFDWLNDMSMIPADVLDWKSQLGKAVHFAIHLHLNNDLDIESLDYQIKPYFDSFVKFVFDTGFQSIHSEKIVYSKKYDYAGMLDLYGMLFKKKSLIDIKCVVKVHPLAAMQTAAYKQALLETTKERTQYRAVLQLSKDNYKLHPYTEESDIYTFLSILNTKNWSQNNGI